MCKPARFFANLDILPHCEHEKLQELIRWFAEGDRATIPMQPFMEYFYRFHAPPGLPLDCSIDVLDFLCLRPGVWLNDAIMTAALATICTQEHVVVAHLSNYERFYHPECAASRSERFQHHERFRHHERGHHHERTTPACYARWCR